MRAYVVLLALVMGCGSGEKSAAPPPESASVKAPPANDPEPEAAEGYGEQYKGTYDRPQLEEPAKAMAAPKPEPIEDYKPADPAAPPPMPEINQPMAVIPSGEPAAIGSLGPGDGGGGDGLGRLQGLGDIDSGNGLKAARFLDEDEVGNERLNRERAARDKASSDLLVAEAKEEAQEKKKTEEEVDIRSFARRDNSTIVSEGVDKDRFSQPTTVLPRTFYFENTYLGGSAAYAERMRRLDAALGADERHYRRVQAEAQPFDPPDRDGLKVTAEVDATHIDRAQRVFLQVGLQGSDRYGWRRPPLDLVVVVDAAAFAQGPAFVTGFLGQLIRKLNNADRVGIVIAEEQPRVFLTIDRLALTQQNLARRIDALTAQGAGAHALAAAMTQARQMLDEASDDEAIVPGTQTVLVLTGGDGEARVQGATAAAHALTVQGAVTSVFTLDSQQGQWWQVANAGYGNFHRITATDYTRAIEEELASIARVVARLVRVNVRLGKDVGAIRVLGTRVLEQREVEAVKARELATDRSLSKTMGITSDRGEDDDGIQTVIPYFYGDDSHVILIELWVERPGTIADVTVRYKDMVNLDNGTARTSVRLSARPQPESPEQTLIAQNVRGFMLGESLQQAAIRVRAGDASGAMQVIEDASAMAAETNKADQEAVRGLKDLIQQPSWQNDIGRRSAVEETLLLSGQRRVGDTNQVQQQK